MKKIRILLLAFLPLAAALHYYFDADAVWVFVTGGIAVAVLADWIRRAAEALAAHAGPGVGGLRALSNFDRFRCANEARSWFLTLDDLPTNRSQDLALGSGGTQNPDCLQNIKLSA